MPYDIRQSSTYEGSDWWSWKVWLEGTPDELARVDAVEYHLHETFPQPIVKVSDAKSKFLLSSGGWGTFTIRARVLGKRGAELKKLALALNFECPDNTTHQPLKKPAATKSATSKPATRKAVTKKPSAKKSVSTSIEPDKAPQAGSPYIFVSYASVDRDVVTKVMERFQRAGVSFRTSDEVPSGAPLQATIEQLIAGASASVAILPGEASRWVEAELQVARDMGKPVFAILGTDAEMPKALSDRQHIQLDDFLARPSAASSAMKRLLGG